MKLIVYLSVCVFFLFQQKVFAYILNPTTVLSRLDQNKPNGFYHLKSKVRFTDFSKFQSSIYLIENWMLSPNQAHLTVTHPNASLLKEQFLYQKFSKKWINQKNKKISTHSNLFVTPYFFMQKIYPSWMLSVKEVSLKRALGVVNYKFQNMNQQIWVEQDSFVIRQMIQNSKYALKAKDYQFYFRKVSLPKKIEIRTPQYMVVIELVSIQKRKKTLVGSLASNQWKLALSRENQSSEKNIYLDMSLVEDFYKNIR